MSDNPHAMSIATMDAKRCFADELFGRPGVQSASALASSGGTAFAICWPAQPKRRRREGWWSLSGSNRRPHACKARALPAELRPHNRKDECVCCRDRRDDRLAEVHVDQSAFALRATAGQPRASSGLPSRSAVRREGWWAWEDLNFRPHAYQARALTN